MSVSIAEKFGRTTFRQENILQSPKTIAFESSNQSAVSEIVDKYGDIVWSATNKFALSPDEAEKLTCEIFSELWEKIAGFDRNITNERDFVMMICLKRIMKYQRNIN